MMGVSVKIIRILILTQLIVVPLAADGEWHSWRGDGSGIASNSTSEIAANVEAGSWRVPVNGLGYSSPVISGDRAYITSAQRVDLSKWSTESIIAYALAVVAFAMWLIAWRSQPSPSRLLGLAAFIGLAAVCVGFEVVQRSQPLSARLLAGSYAIRVWLASSLIGFTALVVGAFVSRRNRIALICTTTLLVVALAWFSFLIPDRNYEESRLHYRWIFWLLAFAGFPLGFRAANFGLRFPITSLVAGVCASLYSVYIVLFGPFHLPSGFWIIGGSMAMVCVSSLVMLWMSRETAIGATTPLLVTVGVPVLLAICGVLIFWGANYGRLLTGTRLSVLCFNVTDGRQLWESGFTTGHLNTPHYANSQASPTPVTDGDRVYAYYGSAGVCCYSNDGQLLWIRDSLPMTTPYGAGTSPILHGDILIVACDSDSDSYIVGLDKMSGKVRWLTHRQSIRGSFGTPVRMFVDGKPVLVTAGGGLLAGYDPQSGTSLWEMELPMTEVVASPVACGDLVFVGSENRLIVYRVGEQGPVQLWEMEDNAPTVVSPIATPSVLLVLSDDGIVTSVATATGKVLNTLQLPHGTYFSSPILCSDVLVCCSKSGVISFVRIPDLKLISEFDLDDECIASPATVGAQSLLFRTASSLRMIKGL